MTGKEHEDSVVEDPRAYNELQGFYQRLKEWSGLLDKHDKDLKEEYRKLGLMVELVDKLQDEVKTRIQDVKEREKHLSIMENNIMLQINQIDTMLFNVCKLSHYNQVTFYQKVNERKRLKHEMLLMEEELKVKKDKLKEILDTTRMAEKLTKTYEKDTAKIRKKMWTLQKKAERQEERIRIGRLPTIMYDASESFWLWTATIMGIISYMWQMWQPGCSTSVIGAFYTVIPMATILTVRVEASEMQAYDCHAANMISNMEMTAQRHCMTTPTNPTLAEILLVERVQYNEIQARRCELRTSRFSVHCGMFSHETLQQVPHIEIVEMIDSAQCLAWTQGHAKVGNHIVPIGDNEEVILHVTEVGSIVWSGSSISCQGQDVNKEGILEQGTLILTQYRARFSMVTLRYDGETVHVIEDRRDLKCSINTESCQSHPATYVWVKKSHHSCSIKKIRKMNGIRIPQDKTTTFIDLKHKLHLTIHEKAQTFCGSVTVFPTTLKDIFVIDPKQQPTNSLQSMKKSEVDITAYINSRDDFLSYYTEKLVDNLRERVTHDDCIQATRKDTSKQNKMQPLSGSVFHIAKGEMEIIVSCKPTTVIPRNAEQCYESLPVLYQEAEWFLHPNSRLLARHSYVIPCSAIFPTAFKTLDGRWIAATPNVHIIRPPNQRNSSDNNHVHQEHMDMAEDAGIFTNSQLRDGIDALFYSGFTQAITSRIATSFCIYKNEANCPPEAGGISIAEIVSPKVLQDYIDTAWTRAGSIFRSIGDTAAIIVCIIIFVNIVYSLMTYVVNVVHLSNVHGLRWKTLNLARPNTLARTAYFTSYLPHVSHHESVHLNNLHEEEPMEVDHHSDEEQSGPSGTKRMKLDE
jgi:hypothetical protein